MKNPLALLVLLVNLKDTFDNFGVGDGEATLNLRYSLSYSAEKVYVEHTANRMSSELNV